jgi:hypothetical protein
MNIGLHLKHDLEDMQAILDDAILDTDEWGQTEACWKLQKAKIYVAAARYHLAELFAQLEAEADRMADQADAISY